MRLLREFTMSVPVASQGSNLLRSDWVLPPNRTVRDMRVRDADRALEPESPQPYVRVTVQDAADSSGSTAALSNWVFQSQLEGQEIDGGANLGPWLGCSSRMIAGGGRGLFELGTGSLNRLAFRFYNGSDAERTLIVRMQLWG